MVKNRSAGRKASSILPSSYRDPSGSVFTNEGVIYRVIYEAYRTCYQRLMGSGLYASLTEKGFLLNHQELGKIAIPLPEPLRAGTHAGRVFRVIRPTVIPFISYPYEWSFSQLKDAALTTLDIALESLEYGMVLKDASPFNIQFFLGKPVHVDTLSFELYEEGEPWVAYRQFCEEFLGPLVLAATADARLLRLSATHLNGIPLDLVSRLLPLTAKLKSGILIHILAHAKSQKRYADRPLPTLKRGLRKIEFQALLTNLKKTVLGLKPGTSESFWDSYYTRYRYSANAQGSKERIVRTLLEKMKGSVVWDLGANLGVYSRIAAQHAALVVAMDMDVVSIDSMYRTCQQQGQKRILPLVMDLTNPSPSIGWNQEERLSLLDRGPADSVLALALLHHLAISSNVPMFMIAKFLKRICSSSLIVEFVPPGDPQVTRMLERRKDGVPDYTRESFELAFQQYFTLRSVTSVRDTRRAIYHYTAKQ